MRMKYKTKNTITDIINLVRFVLLITSFCIFIICIVWMYSTVMPIKLTVDHLNEIQQLTQNYQVNLIYQCPFNYKWFNCNHSQYQNMTGLYCDGELLCENKFIIINKTSGGIVHP